jgi:hypothetical protein
LLTAERRTSVVAVSTVIGATICVIVNIVSIPYLKIWGPVLASLIAFFAMGFYCERKVNSALVFKGKLFQAILLITCLVSAAYLFEFRNTFFGVFALKLLFSGLGIFLIARIYNISLLALGKAVLFKKKI